MLAESSLSLREKFTRRFPDLWNKSILQICYEPHLLENMKLELMEEK